MSKAENHLDMQEEQLEEQSLTDVPADTPTEVTPAAEQPAAGAPSMRKGLLLKNKRIEQGLSLEAVHETTKIPLDALKAIEEDYTIGTLSPFYIRGFIKIYAKYLNVDTNEVLEDYHKEELPQVAKQEVDTDFEFKLKQTLKKYLTHQRRKQIMQLLGLALFLFVLFHAITFLTRSFSERKPKETVRATPVSTPAPSAPVVQEAPVQRTPPVPTPAPAQPEKPKPKATAPRPKPIVRPAPQATPAPPPAVTPAPVEAPQKDIRLTVRAQKDSWLRVKADDKTVFQSTLGKGAVETWQADKEIVLKGKNIIHLEFELNGKMIGTLGRKNRKAKSVTFTKDGLSVTK